RDKQMPDEAGRKIPLNATQGQVFWSVSNSMNLSLIGRAEQVDLVRGMSMTSHCPLCCPNSCNSITITPGSVPGLVGESGQFTATEQDLNCNGTALTPFTITDGTWSSTDTAVATVDSTGVATAVGDGSTNIQLTRYVDNWYIDYTGCEYINGHLDPKCRGDCANLPYNLSVSATCDVAHLRVRIQSPPIAGAENDDTRGALVAGETVVIYVEAIDHTGGLQSGNSSTISFVPSRGLASTETGFPSVFTLSNGSYSHTVLLNRVNGTDRGTTFRFTPVSGK